MNNTTKQKAQEDIIKKFLRQMGYTEDAIKIYFALVKNGPSTLLEISRESGIERTRLYRISDKLVDKGIIEEVPAYKKKTYKAMDLSTIELRAKEKQAQAKALIDKFDIFSKAVNNFEKQRQLGVNVTYYRGIEGLKQMTWHVTKCKGLWRAYSYRFWNDVFGDKFTLDLNKVFNEKNFKVHDLYSDQYIRYKRKWVIKKPKPLGEWSFWKARWISEDIITINQNIDIYNDIVAYSYWDDEDDLFGVEIKNQRIADMQKQIHDVLWKMGKKIDDLDWANPDWTIKN